MAPHPLLNAVFFMPIYHGGAQQTALDAPKVAPAAAAPLDALAGVRRRLYVPRSYMTALMSMIGAYLAAIFRMDAIACQDVAECNNYSKLEWAFSQAAALDVLDSWTAQGRAAMALSAGLHIFSAFLFAQLFIFASLALREQFEAMGKLGLARAASIVPFLGRTFSAFYTTVHCLNAATVVGGNPSKATPVVVGVFLIISFILLVICALFILIGVLYTTVVCCLGIKRATGSVSNSVAFAALSPENSTAMPVAVLAVPAAAGTA